MNGHRYIGPGRAYAVPARDITDAEFEAMNGRQRRIVLASGWYEQVKDLKLADLTRDDLNTFAAQHGVADPAALPNKDAVIAAIDAAEAQE